MADHKFGFRTRALHAGGTPDAEHGHPGGLELSQPLFPDEQLFSGKSPIHMLRK